MIADIAERLVDEEGFKRAIATGPLLVTDVPWRSAYIHWNPTECSHIELRLFV